MNLFKKLLDSDLISKKNLFLHHGKDIGLSLDQTFLFFKIINYNQQNNIFNLEQFVRDFSLNKEETEMLLAQLYEGGFLNVTFNGGQMQLDLSQTWRKFEVILSIPELDWTIDEKLLWMYYAYQIPYEFDKKVAKEIIILNFTNIINFYKEKKDDDLDINILLSLVANNESENLNQETSLNDYSESEREDMNASLEKFKSEQKQIEKLVQKNWLEEDF